MMHHPLLEALTYIDDKLIDVADRTPKTLGMPVPVWRAVAAVLAVIICASIFSVIQYIEDHEIVDVHYPNTRAEYIIYEPSELVETADVICEGTVLDISFYAKKRSNSKDYDIYTVYTIAVSRTYKGFALPIEQIHVGAGLRDYKLKEQLKALQKAGAPKTYRTIYTGSGDIPTPQIGSTYLFCLYTDEDSSKKYPLGIQFALSGDTELESFDNYNPNVIKKYLPYVPHPLLARTVIGGVLLAVLFFIHAKLKKKQNKSNA